MKKDEISEDLERTKQEKIADGRKLEGITGIYRWYVEGER